MSKQEKKNKIGKRTWIAVFLILILIPSTIAMGIWLLDDRKYYFISLLILFYTMIPFFMIFEKREPRARELMVLAVLSAIGVAGRSAFFMVPQFKPVLAICIIAGVCFGAESGFMVGAMIAFVSNFFFGQGPWTPWQMFGFGIVGFVAGILFQKGWLPKKVLPLCIYGIVAAFVIFGGIMNPASVLMFQGKLTKQTLIASYVTGFYFDAIHAAATGFFLLIGANPMIEKLERIKVKYGLVESEQEEIWPE